MEGFHRNKILVKARSTEILMIGFTCPNEGSNYVNEK